MAKKSIFVEFVENILSTISTNQSICRCRQICRQIAALLGTFQIQSYVIIPKKLTHQGHLIFSLMQICTILQKYASCFMSSVIFCLSQLGCKNFKCKKMIVCEVKLSIFAFFEGNSCNNDKKMASLRLKS